MKRTREVLITLILIAITARVLWWALEPIIPYAVAAIGILFIFGTMFFRKRSW